MMKKFITFYTFFCSIALLLMLSGCRQTSSSDPNSLKKKRQQPLQHVNVTVHEVECALCAQAAVDTAKMIDGIYDASYCVEGEQYEEGYLQLVIDANEVVDYQALSAALKKEGFTLVYEQHEDSVPAIN